MKPRATFVSARLLRRVTLAALVMVGVAACTQHNAECSSLGGSPDGQWVVTRCLNTWAGPGTNTYEWSLRLARSDRPRDLTDIIANSEIEPPTAVWESSSKLVIYVSNPDHLTLEVVKFADVQIAVQSKIAVSEKSSP